MNWPEFFLVGAKFVLAGLLLLGGIMRNGLIALAVVLCVYRVAGSKKDRDSDPEGLEGLSSVWKLCGENGSRNPQVVVESTPAIVI